MPDAPLYFIITLAAGLIVGLIAGELHTSNFYRKEAVERGYAEWVVDSSGETKWKWREAQQ
jgi:hypothetical protein